MAIKRYILFVFILVSLLFGSAFRIGPVSLLNLTTIGLLFYAFLKRKEVRFFYGYWLYILYLVVLFAVNVGNGEIITSLFWRNLIGFHCPCLAVMFSFPLIIKREDDLSKVFAVLTVIYVMNLILSLFQFVGNPLAWKIAGFMSTGTENVVDTVDSRLDSGLSLLSIAVVMGLFYSVVNNGYFVACYLPLVTRRLFSTKKKQIIISSIICVLAIVVSFMLQQRMAFLVVFLCLFVLFWFFTKGWTKAVVIVLCIIVASSFIDFSTLNMGRLTFEKNNSDSERHELFVTYNRYVTSGDVLLGGQTLYSEKYGLHQHNTFLSATIYGGVFLLMEYLVLYFGTTIRCIKNFFRGRARRNTYLTASALACCFFNLYSLTHTVGIQSGSSLFWIPYVLMMLALEYDRPIARPGKRTKLRKRVRPVLKNAEC